MNKTLSFNRIDLALLIFFFVMFQWTPTCMICLTIELLQNPLIKLTFLTLFFFEPRFSTEIVWFRRTRFRRFLSLIGFVEIALNRCFWKIREYFIFIFTFYAQNSVSQLIFETEFRTVWFELSSSFGSAASTLFSLLKAAISNLSFDVISKVMDESFADLKIEILFQNINVAIESSKKLKQIPTLLQASQHSNSVATLRKSSATNDVLSFYIRCRISIRR